MKLATPLCLFITLGLASGCNYYFSDGDETPKSTEPDRRIVADVLMSPIRDVDLLFVIDNSGSMIEEQISLARWAEDSLFGVLKTRNLEEFNLHVAVVSTDMGAGPYGVMGCTGDGDGGRMQREPRSVACPAPSDAYISNIAVAGGGRLANHDGTVAEAFACIAQLGTQGCGFEQTLESMKRALDGSNPGNAGFLREEALLAVIIVSDEDDCSALDSAVYNSDPSLDTVNSSLGPLSSFRCFEHGVICDEDLPRALGAKSDCRPREDSEYMASVPGYADFLRGLKADPSLLVVGGITGPSDTVWVGSNQQSEPDLEHSCETNNGRADPAVRLDNFFSEFPARNTVASICNSSLERPLSQVAHRISATANQSPCLIGEIHDRDLEQSGVQADCQVAIVLGATVTDLAECEDGGAQPCYRIQVDLEICETSPSGLAVEVEQNSPPVPGAHIVVRCR